LSSAARSSSMRCSARSRFTIFAINARASPKWYPPLLATDNRTAMTEMVSDDSSGGKDGDQVKNPASPIEKSPSSPPPPSSVPSTPLLRSLLCCADAGRLGTPHDRHSMAPPRFEPQRHVAARAHLRSECARARARRRRMCSRGVTADVHARPPQSHASRL
jgi:hypothetical protein